MDKDEIKNILSQYRRATEKRQRLAAAIEQLEADAVSIPAARIRTEKVTTGKRQPADHTGKYAAQLADASEKLQAATLEVIIQLEKVGDIIDAVPDPNEARVLFERFISFTPWDGIAAQLNKNPEYVRGRLYAAALKSAGKIIETGATGKQPARPANKQTAD